GEAPDLDNYFVAAGMNSVGILTGGGLGRIVAQWIVDGQPDVDVTGFNIDRMQSYQLNPRYRAERTVETLGMVYQTHFPGRSMSTARGVKRSPIHAKLADAGAYFKDVSGWEGADWFAPAGVSPHVDELSWGRQNWFKHWAAEHHAVRNGVGIMDMSFMSKFVVQGRDAGRTLDHLSANAVDGDPGFITYTQWLSDRGTIEADVTVTKLDEQSFMVIASDNAHGHVQARLRRHLDGHHAFATDVTSAFAQINVQGPMAREVLQAATSVSVANAEFPFRAARYIDLGFARALCVRITYLGELGYELYVPAEQAVHAYEQLRRAGAPFDVRHVGLKALSSLRLEKAYRDYGHDIDNTDSVIEAGLGFAVALDKPGGFVGRDAVVASRALGIPHRRLLQVLILDPEPLMHHAEIVLRNGEAVGYVRAASYGHTLGGAVGLAMVDAGEPLTAEWIASGFWEVDVAADRFPARVSVRAMYDPENLRIRA
ncbi:MAG: glycine cleavage T C-terminal barrel domain-containing protein, partial [bacterium]|nr:glycine cleavage T C-terminal barrel domain-containing protein [bacterium]